MSTSPYARVSDVVQRLDFALLLYRGDRRFDLPGRMPKWWASFAGPQAGPFLLDDDYPFLLNFLVDAEEFWNSNQQCCLSSGIWEYAVREDSLLVLEAHAICCHDDSILLIEDIRSHHSNPTDVIRTSRRAQLEMLRDIARRQQIEIELRTARDSALQLQQAKSRLLANTSHELRTPLAGLMGMLELALEQNSDPQGHLKLAFDTAHRLQRTLTELLNYAAVEAQQPCLQLETFCLIQFVRELASGFALAAAEKGLELILRLPDTLNLTITNDRTRLQQIVSNLVDNAIRYTHTGSVTLSARAVGNDTCQIIVSDTGQGISEVEQRLIFEPFERGREAGADNGGKGLGLAIVRELVQALGGQIELTSQPSQGSTFTVTLPSHATEHFQSGDNPQGNPRKAIDQPARAAESDLPVGLRILIAEDSQVNRAYLAHVLRSVNCCVDEVDNGLDLVHHALQTAYDVILTDCRMPGLNGMDAVKRIRDAEQASGKHVPIIAITANSTVEAIERFFNCGIDDILNKPVDRADMIQKIYRQLHLKNLVR